MRNGSAGFLLLTMLVMASACGSSSATQAAAVSSLPTPAPVPGAYRGHVYQTNTVIPPDISFILSADVRSITGLETSAPPSPAMYPDCGGGGFSIAGNQYGFPAPVISVHADGTFAGSATSGANMTVITGHFTDDTLVAEGTIHLVGASIPGQSSCPVNATFKAARVVTCADAPGDGDKVTRWTPVVKCALTLLDQPTTGTNVAAVLALVRLESGGLPIAIGPATGELSGSAGLTQLTDKTFMEYANPALSSNILDPLANIYAALNWALHNRRDISSVGTGLLADPQQVINPKLAACPDEPGGGDVIARWTPVVQCALSLLKQAQSDTNVNAVLALIRRESGGDPNSANRADIPNHFGLTQLPLETFLEYADPVLSANQFDPLANVYAALHFTLANGSSIANIGNAF